VTLVSRSDTVSLSNMPVITEEIYGPNSTGNGALKEFLVSLAGEHELVSDGWKITRFETTPPVSFLHICNFRS
jgi:aminopeptidase 2